MKRKVVKFRKEEEIYISALKPSDNIGWVDNEGKKAYIVYVGDSTNSKYLMSAICSGDTSSNQTPNRSYGTYEHNSSGNISYLIDTNNRCDTGSTDKIYVFDTRKELYKWLSE